MNIRTRILSVITASVFAASMLSGCAAKPTSAAKKTNDPVVAARLENLNLQGFPIVKQPITLKFMVGRHYTQDSYANILTWPTYEKMTNIHIDWDEVLMDNISEKRNLVLASGQNLPDGFFRCGFAQRDPQKYGTQGLFVKWNDLVDQYMPNFKKVMSSMDDVKKGLPSVDGSIYALPSVSDSIEMEVGTKLYMNQKYLDKIGKKLPTNLDELYDVLKAMRDNDANGNGKQDEIPLSLSSLSTLLNGFKGAFGLMNRGYWQGNVDADPKTGKLRFIPTAPEFRQMLEYLNKLYKEKLIDNEVFTNTSAKVTAKVEMGVVGSFLHTNTTIAGSKYVNDYTGLTEALKGPNGDKMWAAIRSKMNGKGAFAMTPNDQYPEATARWMDYWYGEEGSKLFYLGVEGVSFEKTSDGKYQFIPDKIKIKPGSTYDQTVAKFSPYAGGGSPVIALSKYFQGAEMLPVPAKAAQDMQKYAPKELWGYFNYTDEESEELASLEADMFKGYYDNIVPKFISGDTPLNDQTWNDYVAQFDKLNLKRLMEIYNTGYDRYKNMK
ncbi:MAG: ABC transporter substrate-binding protein [Bacillota bacterium]|nr:ABC transporter substrate-binding protein [Bacillota bacterium]